jgi:Fic family protein
MTKTFKPIYTITNKITAGLTRIERARGFLEAATLSEEWVREMSRRALILEAHHTTHIEGTRLTLDQAEQLLAGNPVPEADPDDVQELLNYKKAFEFVSEYLEDGGPITEGLVREIHKRLFTISEYYDRDRSAFYRAIQGVREAGMDMTSWLEYFVEGLTTQLAEVRERGEQAIRRDVLVKEHRLSDRQAKALSYIMEQGSLSIQDFERLSPEVNRRTLQRDLKAMVDRGLIVTEGETHHLLYRLVDED